MRGNLTSKAPDQDTMSTRPQPSTTFRISEIPVDLSKQQLLYFAETNLCAAGEDVAVVHCSLSPSPFDQHRYQIATITFDNVPAILSPCVRSRHEAEFEITAGSVVSFDTHFLGLTPLNDIGRIDQYSVE